METILLKTPLSYGSGYGHDGFALARSLHQTGADVRLEPSVVVPPIPMGVAQLLVKPLQVDLDYVIHHIDPQNVELPPGQKNMPVKKILWSMWEYNSMGEKLGPRFTEMLEGYDLILAYDEVSAHAFKPHADERGIPIKILQGGYWSEDWQYRLSDREWGPDIPFRFGMAGVLSARKNPFAAIRAFEEVHEEFPNTELHLKTNVRTLHPAMEDRYPGLKIHYASWSHEQMRAFYASLHTYVAPSWGEGKNLPALEAQTMGVPVIYSDFGGHRQWGSSEIGWPVAGTLGTHAEGLESFRVDHDALVAAMKDAVRNWQETKRKGELASRLIKETCDWSVVTRRLLQMIRD